MKFVPSNDLTKKKSPKISERKLFSDKINEKCLHLLENVHR